MRVAICSCVYVLVLRSTHRVCSYITFNCSRKENIGIGKSNQSFHARRDSGLCRTYNKKIHKIPGKPTSKHKTIQSSSQHRGISFENGHLEKEVSSTREVGYQDIEGAEGGITPKSKINLIYENKYPINLDGFR